MKRHSLFIVSLILLTIFLNSSQRKGFIAGFTLGPSLSFVYA